MADISARQVNPASSATDTVNAVPVARVEHRESTFARMVEQQTAKIPSHIFLISSFVAMSISLSAELTGRRRTSRFVGMWVAPLLIMGVYNKMVKMFGSR